MSKRVTSKRAQKAAFSRTMYPGPFCETCFCHHGDECPQYIPIAAYCPCTFRKNAGLKCVPGALHHTDKVQEGAA